MEEAMWWNKIMPSLAMVVALLAVGAPVAQAIPAYSAKPVTLVVPYAASGATDVIARILEQRLGAI